jgi:hypothetical protein
VFSSLEYAILIFGRAGFFSIKCSKGRLGKLGYCAKLLETLTGGVAEWFNAAVLKTVRLERVSGVRIPPPPPQRKSSINMRLFEPCYYFCGDYYK